MEPLSPRLETIIPFHHQGRSGYVVVSYGKIEDPVRAGFDSLPGLSFDIDRSLGYPMMHARIETYEGSGYRTFCGWIQVVTREEYDSYENGTQPAERSVSVDLPPSLQDLEVPFAACGNLPQLFDAPCLNLGSHARLEWIADTFLTTVPLRSRDEPITPLVGFRWGYIEYDTPEERPVALLPLEVTEEREWKAHLPILMDRFPAWRFGEAG